jgi:hypothetical protein
MEWTLVLMADLTFITAVAPYHNDTLQRAIDSVQAQTIPCEHIVVYDTHKVGAGWARNIGLEQVKTPFVAFLDADDWIDSTFAEKCLQAFDGKRYVYVDHWHDDKWIHAPVRPFFNRTWHVITALLPTAWVYEVGMFDETLPGAEDTGLFMALMASGHCGKRLPEPLFHYSASGQRGREFVNNPIQSRVMSDFTEKYGAKAMACCGDSEPMDSGPINEPLPGDVEAMATWMGNRQERGRATGRLYPRAGNGKIMFVNPKDIEASPQLWTRTTQTNPLPTSQPRMTLPAQANVRVITPAPPDAFPQMLMPPLLDGAQGVGAAFNEFQRANFPAPPPPPQTVAPVAVTPDVAKVTALYRAAMEFDEWVRGE